MVVDGCFLPPHFLAEPWLAEAAAYDAFNADVHGCKHLVMVADADACAEGVTFKCVRRVQKLALRFTPKSIDSRLHSRNQRSLFKTFDELQRGVLQTTTFEEPLNC